MTKLTPEERSRRNSEILVPWIAAMVATVMLLACFVLPLLTASQQHRNDLMKDPESREYFGEALTNEQATELSMYEFFLIYWNTFSEEGPEESVTAVCIFCGTAILAALMLVLALLKKPIPVLILNVLAIFPYMFATLFIGSKDVFMYMYTWSWAKDLYLLAFVAVLGCGAWLLVKKMKITREILDTRDFSD